MNKFFMLAVLICFPVLAQTVDPVTEAPAAEVSVIEESTADEANAAAPQSEDTVETAPEGAEKAVTISSEENAPEVAPEVPAAETSPVAEMPQPIENASTPVLTTEVDDNDKRFNHRKSHWITSYGFEGMKYETPWNPNGSFTGVKKNFKEENAEYWGGRIGIGGQLYLGLGFWTASKIEGYYNGTVFSKVLNGGARDADVKFAYTTKKGQIYGGDAVQQLGFMFDLKTKNPFLDEMTYLTVEPYVEAGIGTASAWNRINYSYKLDSTDEAYRLTIKDNLVNARIGAGINFTANSGFFLYLRVTQNRYDITDRKATEVIKPNGSSQTSNSIQLDDKIRPVTVYALGGGYKF